MDLEKEISLTLAKMLLENRPVSENDSIEEQFQYYALKLGVTLSEKCTTETLTVDQQDKLIPLYKDFINRIEKILKGEYYGE